MAVKIIKGELRLEVAGGRHKWGVIYKALLLGNKGIGKVGGCVSFDRLFRSGEETPGGGAQAPLYRRLFAGLWIRSGRVFSFEIISVGNRMGINVEKGIQLFEVWVVEYKARKIAWRKC